MKKAQILRVQVRDCNYRLSDWSLPYAAQVSEALVGAGDLEQLLETKEMPDAHNGTHHTPQRHHLADALIVLRECCVRLWLRHVRSR